MSLKQTIITAVLGSAEISDLQNNYTDDLADYYTDNQRGRQNETGALLIHCLVQFHKDLTNRLLCPQRLSQLLTLVVHLLVSVDKFSSNVFCSFLIHLHSESAFKSHSTVACRRLSWETTSAHSLNKRL